jgi:hypothetical protein
MLEPWFSILINGKVVGEDMLKYVESIEVEDEEDKLPLVRINIIDPEKIWLNDKGIMKGAKVKVKLGHRYNNRMMFDGKVTHVDADYPVSGDPVLTIGAIDKAIELMEEREARNFKNAKVSDVVKIMLKECGLKGNVQDTKAVLEHIPQERESNLEFITRWRKKLGWKFYRIQSEDKYYFGEKKKSEGKDKVLGYKTGGMEIISFAPSYVDQETSDDEKVSDVDNDGKVAEYTIRDTKEAIVYPGLNDSTKPIGRA